MRDILIVTKFTLIEALKKKAFIVSTIIMILMIILASAFTKIIPKLADSNEKDKILIVDNDNIFENQLNTMNELGLNRLFLHAFSIRFEHPKNGETLRFNASLDHQMKAILQKLRESK